MIEMTSGEPTGSFIGPESAHRLVPLCLGGLGGGRVRDVPDGLDLRQAEIMLHRVLDHHGVTA